MLLPRQLCIRWVHGQVSVFQQPSLEKNALHEYLDNEDAAAGNTAAAAAARRGARGAGEAGFGGEWGRAGRAASNEHEEEDDDDDDMGVRQFVRVFSNTGLWLCISCDTIRVAVGAPFAVWERHPCKRARDAKLIATTRCVPCVCIDDAIIIPRAY